MPRPRSRDPEHSCSVHKPPRLELSLAKRRGFSSALAADLMVSQWVGVARCTKHLWGDISPHSIPSIHVAPPSMVGKHCRLTFPFEIPTLTPLFHFPKISKTLSFCLLPHAIFHFSENSSHSQNFIPELSSSSCAVKIFYNKENFLSSLASCNRYFIFTILHPCTFILLIILPGLIIKHLHYCWYCMSFEFLWFTVSCRWLLLITFHGCVFTLILDLFIPLGLKDVYICLCLCFCALNITCNGLQNLVSLSSPKPFKWNFFLHLTWTYRNPKK